MYPDKYITWCIFWRCYGNTHGSRSALNRIAIPVFHVFRTSSALKTFMGRSSLMGTLGNFEIGWWVSPYRVTNGNSWSKAEKRTGTKSVPIKTSKYAPFDVFPRVHHYCQDSDALPFYLQRYSSFCVLAPYWNNLWRHQLSNLHNTKSWISLEREKISQKGKHHRLSFWKAFYVNLSCFLLHMHFNLIQSWHNTPSRWHEIIWIH